MGNRLRYVATRNLMLFVTNAYRSFASLRMTTKRNVVILSEAKDLYMKIINHLLLSLMTLR